MKTATFVYYMSVKKNALRIAYLDCSSGISGDMFMGAIVDAGVPLEKIERGLKGLPIKGARLEARKVKRSGIAATKVDVVIRKSGIKGQKSEARRWKDIKAIIEESSLEDHIRQKGLRIFRRLFEAEGKVHGTVYSKTHLHELGAEDCIADIFGTLIGLDILGVDRVYSSALNLGSGSVMTDHGRLPVPAPATSEILREFTVYSSSVPFELTTPTGAAILREVALGSIAMPLMRMDSIGYGAGQKDIPGSPNILRILVGTDVSYSHNTGGPGISVIETNIDDMNPQIYEYVMELLFKAGALDAYLTPVIMKKGRPGTVLTILCEEDKKASIMDIVFRETSTIGLRFHEVSRAVLKRKVAVVETEIGRVKIKLSEKGDGSVKISPEYEDCKRLARRYNRPLVEVMRMAERALKVKPR